MTQTETVTSPNTCCALTSSIFTDNIINPQSPMLAMCESSVPISGDLMGMQPLQHLGPQFLHIHTVTILAQTLTRSL